MADGMTCAGELAAVCSGCKGALLASEHGCLCCVPCVTGSQNYFGINCFAFCQRLVNSGAFKDWLETCLVCLRMVLCLRFVLV
jgi:hypothetical protein